MKIHIEIDETELKKLVHDAIAKQLGDVEFATDEVKIEVKSKQNWKAEWESAAFRAVLDISN